MLALERSYGYLPLDGVDTATGSGAIVGPLQFANVASLALDSVGGRLLAAGSFAIFEVDALTGAGVQIVALPRAFAAIELDR